MSGFLVEIFSSLSEPAPGLLLAEINGHQCLVSTVNQAQVFETEDEVRSAADRYCRAVGCVNFRLVRP
jgi:hypothetical protein